MTPEALIPSPSPSPCLREEGVELDDPSEVLSILIFCPPRGESQGPLGGEEGPPAAMGEDGSPHSGLREMKGSIGYNVSNCYDTETLHSLPLVRVHGLRLPGPLFNNLGLPEPPGIQQL